MNNQRSFIVATMFLLMLLIPLGAFAQNLKVFDIDRQVTKSDRGFPRDDPPAAAANGNWLTPINYAGGTLHMRAEIRRQPVPQSMRLQFCMWQYNFTLETCTSQRAVSGQAGTVVTWTSSIPNMWKKDGKDMDWANPRQRYGMVVKNSAGLPVSDFRDWNWNGENPDAWYPLDIKFSVVAVPVGGTFVGWTSAVLAAPPGPVGGGVGGGVTAPSISTQPANQSAIAGQSATFAVVASGTAPLSYQWQRNGVNIPGATGASYTTPATTLADNGAVFRCRVSNTAGNVTSGSATLTVTGGSGGGNNVVQNAGFESGTSGWNFYTNATGSFTVAGPGDGSANAAVVTTTTVGTNIQLNQSDLALQPNTAYRLTFSAYSNTGRDLRVSVLKHGSPFTNYGLNRAIANLTTGWQSFTFDFTTTGFSTPVTDARLMFWFASDAAPGDQFRIDNVSLATAASSTPVSGLVAAYNFDEVSGATVLDASGLGNHGTLNGAAIRTDGKFGRALFFDGYSNWVTLPDARALDLTTAMTLEAWVHPNQLNDRQPILAKQGTTKGSPHRGYMLSAGDPSGQGRVEVEIFKDDNNKSSLLSSAALNTSDWQHVAFVYQYVGDGSSTMTLYINGVARGSSTAAVGPVQKNAQPLELGRYYWSSGYARYFNGLIDNVRIYNRALTASEIRTNMDTPVGTDR
jgi:hypothetical protein